MSLRYTAASLPIALDGYPLQRRISPPLGSGQNWSCTTPTGRWNGPSMIGLEELPAPMALRSKTTNVHAFCPPLGPTTCRTTRKSALGKRLATSSSAEPPGQPSTFLFTTPPTVVATSMLRWAVDSLTRTVTPVTSVDFSTPSCRTRSTHSPLLAIPAAGRSGGPKTSSVSCSFGQAMRLSSRSEWTE